MTKGIIIMLIVFAVVAILGWVLNKFGNASEEKKKKFRKYFFGFYGMLLIVQGTAGLLENPGFNWMYVVTIAVGLLIVGVVLFGKLEKSAESTG
jgi:uncharacterized membrane protein